MEYKPERIKTLEILDQLCADEGILDYETFASVWELVILPGGVEERSGLIITEDNRVYRYWLEWDADKLAPSGEKGWYSLGKSFKELTGKELEKLKGDLEYRQRLKSQGIGDARG